SETIKTIGYAAQSSYPPLSPLPFERRDLRPNDILMVCFIPASATPTCTKPITIYLKNDGRLEHAQQMAGHESPRSTLRPDKGRNCTLARRSECGCDNRCEYLRDVQGTCV